MSVLGGAASKLKDMPSRIWLLLALLAAAAIALIGIGGTGSGAQDVSALEARLERVLKRVEGAGDVSVMAIESNGEVTGVLIVAQGAADMKVRLTLQNAVKTLLGIDNAQIDIVRMEGEAYETE